MNAETWLSLKRKFFTLMLTVLRPFIPLISRSSLAWKVRAVFFRAGHDSEWLRNYGPHWDAAPLPEKAAVFVLADMRASAGEQREALLAALGSQRLAPAAVFQWHESTAANDIRQFLARAAEAPVMYLTAAAQPHPELLARFVQEMESHGGVALAYADEVQIDEEGREHVFCKPGWDPLYFDRSGYAGQVFAFRGEWALAAFTRETPADARSFFKALVPLIDSRALGHIPVPLYRAPARFFPLAGATAKGPVLRSFPKASLIIPFRDRLDLLRPCLDSLAHRTDYPEVEFILVDNGSREKATLDFLRTLAEDHFQVVRRDCPFNFSFLVNCGARAATGEILVLLNNDITVCSERWLQALVAWALRPEVGCVGAKLLYPAGMIQHGGVLCGEGLALDGKASPCHAHTGWPGDSAGYFGLLGSPRTMSAVTGAVLAVRRELYQELGGFDEGLAVAMNDVDFCLRLREKGFQCVWTPDSLLIHHESATRKMDMLAPEKMERLKKEWRLMREKWGAALDSDPWYNPNLSREASYELGAPPRSRSLRCCVPPRSQKQ